LLCNIDFPQGGFMKVGNVLSVGGALAILAMGVPVFAQSGSPATHDAQTQNQTYHRDGLDMIGFMDFHEGAGHTTVKGKPYSAQVTTETKQVLSDGSHIDRKSTGLVARDTDGRTRRDMSFPGFGRSSASGTAPHVTFINDPVANVRYLLDADKKVARKMTPPSAVTGRPGTRGAGKSENVTTQSLGTQTIEGVQAEGTRTTRTIPVGAIGNDQPIQIVTERWFSPDLQTFVMVKHSDPRSGETTYQLTGINRSAPDASLFEVPPDYTVTVGQPGHHRGMNSQQ
jgi:hypothetical protein